MKIKRLVPVLLIILVAAAMLTACGPSEADIQAAIAETQAAQLTKTTVPTDTPEPTSTPSPTPSSTPSPTPDLRVIDEDPKAYLLEKSNLPKDAR